MFVVYFNQRWTSYQENELRHAESSSHPPFNQARQAREGATNHSACPSLVPLRSGRHTRKIVQLSLTESGNLQLPFNLHAGPIFLSRHEASGDSARPVLGWIFRGNLQKKNDSRVSEMDEPRGNYSSMKAEPDKSEEIFPREAEAGAGWFVAYLRHLSILLDPLLTPSTFSTPIKQTNKWTASQLLFSHLMEENILARDTKSLTLPQTAPAQRQKQP